MDLDKLFNVEQLAGQQIPSEIAEQLKVLGRIQFPLKDTSAPNGSAVSSAGDQLSDDENANQTNISGILDHVEEMESLTDQLEDMLDQLTKDMAIPVDTDDASLKDAVSLLGGDGNTITKDIFDKAQAIIDHAPIMILGQDPVLASLTGNGKLEGDYMNCDEITRGVAKAWNTADPKSYSPESILKDNSAQIAKDFEKNKDNLIAELLLMLFWNRLWGKFIVGLIIINPLRHQYAYPFDIVVTFFKNMKRECGKGRFRIKPKSCLKLHGPINKALTKLACFLLCKLPRKFYKRYRPEIDPSELKCKCGSDNNSNCPPESTKDISFDRKGDLGQLGNLFDSIESPCPTIEDYADGVNDSQPTDLGINPNCIDAAKKVLDAVISEALTPNDPKKTGITGTASISSILQEQSNQLGT